MTKVFFSSADKRRYLLILFAISCLFLNAAAFFLYQKNAQVQYSRSWISHSYNVLKVTVVLFAHIQQLQTTQRGFLLTGDERFLKRYNEAAVEIPTDIQNLKKLTKDNKSRSDDIEQIEALFNEKHALLNQMIAQRQSGIMPDIEDVEKSRQLMEKLYALHNHIISDEEKLLSSRRDVERDKERSYVATLLASSGLSLLGLIIANGVIVFLTFRRRAAEENLLRLRREMEGFTYIASHDLRSPLVNLRGFSSEMRIGLDEIAPIIAKASAALSPQEIKKLDDVLNQDLPDALGYIQSSVDKMDKLTNGILELSRIGRREMNVEPVNAEEIVQRCLNALQHQISEKKVDVKVGHLPVAMTDALALEQIFGNIIDNAVKYLDPSREGKIEIGGKKSYGETIYWVRDNGRGISAEDQQKIFEIYRRGGSAGDVPGEGVGMAYVRATLRRMGGAIRCESEPGKGSTFYFTVSNALRKEAS